MSEINRRIMRRERKNYRSDFINRRRARILRGIANPMVNVQYGRPTVLKLKRYATGVTNGSSIWNTVYGLVDVLQDSNDWANVANTFALFNIIAVKIVIYPGSITTNKAFCILGMAYDPKDAGSALTDINQIGDYTQYQYILANTGACKSIFRFKPKPNGNIPMSVSSTAENYGSVKCYSATDFGATTNCCVVHFTFTVAFGAPE